MILHFKTLLEETKYPGKGFKQDISGAVYIREEDPSARKILEGGSS